MVFVNVISVEMERKRPHFPRIILQYANQTVIKWVGIFDLVQGRASIASQSKNIVRLSALASASQSRDNVRTAR